MDENLFHDLRILNDGNNPHSPLALRANERVYLVYLLDEVRSTLAARPSGCLHFEDGRSTDIYTRELPFSPGCVAVVPVIRATGSVFAPGVSADSKLMLTAWGGRRNGVERCRCDGMRALLAGNNTVRMLEATRRSRGEWRRGTSPLRSLRTRRESLDSPGSHYPAEGRSICQ